MRLDVLHRREPASPASVLLRDAWKYGLGVGVAAVLLTAGGADRVQPHPHALASTVLPTTVPCGPIATDPLDPLTATWTATRSPYGTGSPYNLPVSTTNNPDPTVPSCDAIVVPHDVTLKIDTSQGPVQIFSHGAAINVDGGHLLVLGTSETNSALFDAEPDVASWDGIVVTAYDSAHRGNASLAFASIQHALNSITITSGATSTPDPTKLSAPLLPYGLALINSGIGPSYFDGIDATDTPVLVQGQADSVKHRADGKFGTVNNIGSQGIKLSFDASAPAVPQALHVDSVAFGSSVPFAETSCLPLQDPCSRGSIGNDAILANFTSANAPPVSISQSRFYRAGSFGIELNGPNGPVIKDNNFDCNGTGSPKPTEVCVGSGTKYSAIYLNNATADLENSITNNVGHEDGMDAIGFNGTIVYASNAVPQRLTWKNATNDAASDHPLGYLLNGALNLTSGTLVVPGGSVVKSTGAINLTGAALDASDTSDSRSKVFTSLRDNADIPSNTNIVSCPSVFVQSCPSPLPAGEWGGINLVGSRFDATIRNATTGTINNAAILYATTGVNILNGASLTIVSSAIGPTFADGVQAEGTPIAVTGTTFGCPAGVCSGPSNGNHGILADFRSVGPLTGGLKVGGPNRADTNTFKGSVNEAIRGVGLTGQTVDIQNNEIQNAGAVGSAGSAGIYLQGAGNLILQHNHLLGSGTGNLHYPAIWLDGVSHADFSGPISDNTGSGNGLNAIAFHGDSKTLAWQTAVAGGQLGFIVDGNLLVAGDLTLASGDYAPVQGGTITVENGTLTSSGATLTSLREQTLSQPSCGSVFVPRISGVCPPQSAGDWGGLVLDPGKPNLLAGSQIRYAVTGITMSTPTGTRPTENLTLTGTSISRTAADGLTTRSPVSISGGAFTNNGGRGIKVDLTGVTPSVSQPLTITGHTGVSDSGTDGILAVGLGGHTVQLEDARVDRAGAFGINLKDADHLTLRNNTVISSAATFPAIYLNGFSGLFANISGNKGAGNGVDAIAFHGTVTDNLTWQTARQTSDPTRLLGYILDNTLNMQSSYTLTVKAGDIVKVGSGGALNLQGVTLKGDDTGNSSQKVFTSLTDDSVGVAACHSAVVTGCTGAPHVGDWGGIGLTGSGANGALVNAAVRYASTGILVTSQASSTAGSSAFGLVVSRSSIGPTFGDGIAAVKTSISVTDSTISGGTHGITLDYGGAIPNTALRVSGNRFMSTSAEAILGQALSGRPVWITDNHVQGAGTFGIRLLNADEIVLRNNNVAGSGGGPDAGAARYPAIYLKAVSADFVANIRGNVGSGNGLDALVMHGEVTGDLTWITPSSKAATHALGYLLDGGLTLQGGTLTVGPGDVVKSLGGPITINGGRINANGSATPGGSAMSHSAIFTSLKDNPNAPVLPVDMSDAAAVSCPSVFTASCSPASGDWGGLVITKNAAGLKGSGTIAYGLINYANTGISLDSGPISASPEASNFRLTVANTRIGNASKDGITSNDTPFSVDSSTVENVGASGIFASFFSPANCSSTPGTCVRLNITNVHVTASGMDGIIANGLAEHPITVSGNTVTGAGGYGIWLVGADLLTLVNNTVNTSGIGANAYPAIYLSGVSGDFNTAIMGNEGAGNGLNALVFHGTANNGLTWVTPGAAAPTLGYMLDSGLTVNGNFTSTAGVVKVLSGSIKINGALTSIGTVYTSMKEDLAPKACHTVFVPSACPNPVSVGDYWDGINVAGTTTTSSLNGGAIRYAKNGVTVSGAPISVTGQVQISQLSGDAITVTNAAARSKFEDLTVDHVVGNGIKLVNSDATFSRDVFTNMTGTGNFGIKSAGGTVSIDCSTFHDNANGVSFDGASSIAESDAYSNGTYDVIGTAGSPTATAVWWGQPNMGGNVSGVTVLQLLASQAPVLIDPPTPGGKIEITGTNPTATDAPALRALGIGKMTDTLTYSRRMDPTIDPTVTFKTSQLGDATRNVTTAVGGTWADRVWTSNPYPIDQLHATAGLNHLSVSGARGCVPDGPNAMVVPPSKDFYAAVLPTVVAVQPGATATYGGTTTLQAALTSNGLAVANETASPVQFTILDAASQPFATASAGTDGAGLATTGAIGIAGLGASPPSYGIRAVFLGDNIYSASALDDTQVVTVSKVATATTTSASATAVATGAAVTDQATVAGVASTVSGTVTYKLFSSVGCTGAPVFTDATASFASGNVPASATWTATPPGSYQWQATYSGDSNHLGSTSVCGNDGATVAASTPTLATVPSAGGTVGGTISDTANISGGFSPTGSVSFALYPPGDAACSTDLLAADNSFHGIALVSGSASTPNYTTTQAGTFHWVATYSGDTNNVSVTGGCSAEPVLMTKATPTLATVTSAGGTVGGNITDTANVTGGFSPTGSVSFQLFGPGDSGCLTDLLGSSATFHGITLTSGSATTPSHTTTQAGTYHWIATYTGDANNMPVAGVCADEPVTVAKASPSVATLVSAGGTVGESITDKATVSAGFSPTGTVSFELFAPGDSTCTTDLLTSSATFHDLPLSSGSATTPSYSTTHAGTYQWIATYNGDDNNAVVATTCADEPVTLAQAAPTIGTVASAGGTVGAVISDTATVTSGFNPTGSVSFALYAPADPTCLTDLLASAGTFHNVALASGSASTPNYTTTTAGTYRWIATYNGDANNVTRSMGCNDEPVTMAQATPSLTTSVAPASPVVTATNVKDQAVLTGATPDAGGTVTYNLYSGTVCTGSPVFADTRSVVAAAAGQSLAFSASPAGSYTWQASYSGDTSNQATTSTCGSDPLVVNDVPATISSVSPSSGPVAGNTSVTITGTHMAGASVVTFGAVAGTIETVTDTQITARSPVGSVGSVDIMVTTPSGTSTANPPNDQFTFVAYATTIGADSPALYWRLGESTGPTAADATGNGHVGTYAATGVTWSAAGALKGDLDTSITLNGSTGSIQETSGAGVPTGSSPRSLEIWFKTSTSSVQPLFNYGTAGSLSQFSVYLSGNLIEVNDGTETLTLTAASSLSDGLWHHLVVTYDGSTGVTVYIDGAIVGSTQATSGTLATLMDVSGLEVGEDNASGFFSGSLDETALYSSALSSAQVATHFHAGHGDP